MASENSSLNLVNNTIVYNNTGNTGGGICTLASGSSISGVNNIIYFNISSDNTQYASVYGGGACSLNYSCISQSMSGTGNITEDPVFVNASADDYQLTAGSPCIDAGDPTSSLDPDGTRADMGAFYFNQLGIGEGTTPSHIIELYSPCPNPSTSAVNISYRTAQAVNVRLSIYNLTGRHILDVADRLSTAGIHTEVWDGADRSGRKVDRGIYFCTIQADGFSQTRGIIML